MFGPTHPHSGLVWDFLVLVDLARLLVDVLLFLCALRAPFAVCAGGSAAAAVGAGAAWDGPAIWVAAGATSM